MLLNRLLELLTMYVEAALPVCVRRLPFAS
jgi:hypothetical protein